jgi:hypothetical protein
LAFKDDGRVTAAKLGILIASLCAGIVGSVILARVPREPSGPATQQVE